jgi:hypothetical protein
MEAAVSGAVLETAADRIEQIARMAAAGNGEEFEYGLAEYGSDALERLQILLDRLAQSLSLEIRVQSPANALTVVAWNGDVSTICVPELDEDQRKAHFVTLSEALRFRSRMIEIIAASVKAVTAISAALSSPLGAALALRAVVSLAGELQLVVSASSTG